MNSLWIISFTLLVATEVRSARILGLFPHVGRSHYMVFEPLLLELRDRGHEITIVSFFPSEKPLANYTEIDLTSDRDIEEWRLDFSSVESNGFLQSLDLLGKMFQVMKDTSVAVCTKLVDFAPLAEALKGKYDVILVESFFSDCMFGLLHVYKTDAPVVAVSSLPALPWSSARIGLIENPAYVPILTSEHTSRMSFGQRIANTAAFVLYNMCYSFLIQATEQEIIEKHFGRKIPSLETLAKNTSLLITNSYHALNGVRPSVPALVEVGGLHLKSTVKPLPSFIKKFLDESKNGVVVFSFGSLLKTSSMPQHKQRIIMNVLSKLNERVIWKFEDSDENGTMEGNILKVRWLPQYDLLRHEKVIAFIGHGGLLGVTEVMSVGKPMLVIPFFGDQLTNAAAVAEVGLGKVLTYSAITEETFSEALKNILDAAMRLSARRASQIWHDRESKPLDKAVYWVEYVIRWGHHAPLYSAAKDLSFTEIALLDVAAVFILIGIVMAIVIKCFISRLIYIVTFKSKTHNKID